MAGMFGHRATVDHTLSCLCCCHDVDLCAAVTGRDPGAGRGLAPCPQGATDGQAPGAGAGAARTVECRPNGAVWRGAVTHRSMFTRS